MTILRDSMEATYFLISFPREYQKSCVISLSRQLKRERSLVILLVLMDPPVTLGFSFYIVNISTLKYLILAWHSNYEATQQTKDKRDIVMPLTCNYI